MSSMRQKSNNLGIRVLKQGIEHNDLLNFAVWNSILRDRLNYHWTGWGSSLSCCHAFLVHVS